VRNFRRPVRLVVSPEVEDAGGPLEGITVKQLL
jgi:hypothetical protein